MAGKKVSLASLAGAKVEAVPGAGRPDLVHVHPDTVAPTPLNPRRSFDETELAELGEDMRSGQLQPCVAVAKAAYLKLYPEHAGQLPDGCRYVMAAGERRWRAARMVGLDSLDVLLRHDLTESRIRFLAAVLSENVQRANFNPIEEADGLRAMLDLHDGNQSAAAQAMGKSKGWFNQRIGLLRLTDEMVQLVLEGKLTAFRDMRRYASMPAEEQYAAWKRDQEQPRPPALPKASPAPATATPIPEAALETYTAVYAPPPAPAPAAVPDPGKPAPSFTAVKPPTPAPAPQDQPPPPPAPASADAGEQDAKSTLSATAEQIPEPRADLEATPKQPVPEGRKLPYEDGHTIGQHLTVKMDVEPFVDTIRVMTAQCWDKAGPVASFGILRSMLEAAVQRDTEAVAALLDEVRPQLPGGAARA